MTFLPCVRYLWSIIGEDKGSEKRAQPMGELNQTDNRKEETSCCRIETTTGGFNMARTYTKVEQPADIIKGKKNKP